MMLALLFTGIILITAVYWPGLHGAFFFDDESNILAVDEIKIEHLSFESINQALSSGIASELGRPVSQLSFALNYYFSGFDPFEFKLTNLIIHFLNGLLVYLIAVQLFAATRPKDNLENTHLLAALIAVAWLLHPIQMTSVLYVVQRMTSLSALFLLAALWLHISVRQQKQPGNTYYLLISWLILWPLSVLSKESGLLFFGYILAYELIIRRSTHQSLDLFGKILLWLSLAMAACITLYLLTPSGTNRILNSYGTRTFTLAERLLTEPRVIWNYIGLIVFPRLGAFGLHHDDIAISSSLLKPWTTLPALLGIAGLILTAWWTRKRQPLLAFGIVWFLVAHGIESTALGLEIAHEHRNYLGLFGILMLPIVFLRQLRQRQSRQKALVVFLLLLLVHTGIVTALRSKQFENEVRRTLMEAEYHPLSARSSYAAAHALVSNMLNGTPSMIQISTAKKLYEISLKLEPEAKMGYLGLIHLSCLTGQKLNPAWMDELTFRLEKTKFALGDRSILYSLKEMMVAGTLCLENQEVRRLFNAALANKTASADARALLFSWYSDYLYLHEKNLPDAMRALKKAMDIVPKDTSNQFKWAQLLFLDNRKEEALQKLKILSQSELNAAEKKTFTMLMNCIQASNCSKM